MPKRQKSSKGRDIISNLPDFIIGHILSFLNTKDAVRTSALSKRWIYMWTFVTSLTFFDSYRSSSNFSNFVSRVLFHLNSASIEDFFLSIREDYDPYVNQWLSAVLNRRVKKLTVHSWFKVDLSSCPLFQSPSLEEMWLQMTMRGRCIINVPTFASLPSLTVLKLTGITFTCYSSNKLKELTLKFPLLRKYFTTDCTWSAFKSITLEAPLLEEVTIVCSTPLHKSHTEIKLCVSHVTDFYYCGFISLETILLNGHIASAQICLQNSNDTTVEEKLVFVRKLLNLFTNIECLRLCFIDHLQAVFALCSQCLARLEHHLPGIPAFGVLDHLQLCWVTLEVLLSLLLKSPCLKTLVLEMKDCDVEKQNFAIVPDCFLSTLKVVKFESFSGGECELSFAKFVMENARVLERIDFSFKRKLPSSKVKKAKAKLFLFKRSFSTVIMEFSTHGY